jgi:DNA-binding SARP family transcriptional activator
VTDVTDEGFRLSVLGGFRLAEGGRALVTLSAGSQRLLAFLALQDQESTRALTAGTLWPDVPEAHAYASLRSALSRLDVDTRRAVLVSLTELCLAEGVAIDLHSSQDLAHRLLHPTDPVRASDLSSDSISSLSTELLPGWYDDWVVVEAEDWRQLRLHALEALSARLTEEGRYGDAATSALAAIRAEPLRESSHGALIRVHLAEGNQTEAIREFDRYRRLLNAELGLEPSARLRDLVDKLLYT